MSARLTPPMLLPLGLLLISCFSQDDFTDCTSDEQCGFGRYCDGNECRFKSGNINEGDTYLPPAQDRYIPPLQPDTGPELEVVTLGEPLVSGAIEHPNTHLLIDGDLRVKALSREASEGGYVHLRARVIELTGSIDARASGEPGGGGGGGGGGKVREGVEDSIGGLGGTGPLSAQNAESGHTGTVDAPGRGGDGMRGGGENACGGVGGLAGNEAPGAPGSDGARVAPSCPWNGVPVFGCGGGGGGGGGGVSNPSGPQFNGFGGGGGGAGGRGGGMIVLVAEDEIIINGDLAVGGEAAPVDGEMQRNGVNQIGGSGGSGMLGERDNDGPGLGGDVSSGGDGTLNAGGLGGAGAGGWIILKAPKITFEGGAIDLVGGGNAENRGSLIIETADLIGTPTGPSGEALSSDCPL